MDLILNTSLSYSGVALDPNWGSALTKTLSQTFMNGDENSAPKHQDVCLSFPPAPPEAPAVACPQGDTGLQPSICSSNPALQSSERAAPRLAGLSLRSVYFWLCWLMET